MSCSLFFTRRRLLAGTPHAMLAIALVRPSWAAEALPKMIVTRGPNCGCCEGWTKHVLAAGFPAEVNEVSDLAPLKARLGVPQGLFACHTAQIDGYVIEGHVPAEAIKRLLDDRPRATGLAVAGMPVGSPGMEVPGTAPEDYEEVVLFAPGAQRVFARYRGEREI